MRMGKATYYRTELVDFKEQYDRKLSWIECQIVHKKLWSHYKLKDRFCFGLRYNGRICGRAHSNGIIELGRQGMNVGVLCHEVAHVLAYKKYKTMKHTKKLYRIMTRIMNYSKKKNYWSEELVKRSAPRPVKPVLSVDELRRLKIVKRKDDIVRYEKRLAYFSKLYSGKISKARRSIAMLERLSTVSIP